MNPLWLLAIVPGTAVLTVLAFDFFWPKDRASDADEWTINLLYRQYKQLRASIEDIWPKPHGLADLLARHDRERAELGE